MDTLEVKNLQVAIDAKPILNGVTLTVRPGETHAIMGPNGSGKSTLAQTLFHHPKYTVTGGAIKFAGQTLNTLSTDKIAGLGMLLAFQYPQSVSGVSVQNLLKVAQSARGLKVKLDLFLKNLKAKAKAMRLPSEFLTRSLNEGFSGGEKKKTEILQLSMLYPKLVVLDETDSGLDVDALKIVGREVNKLKKTGVSVIIITHYNRILKYIEPDFVHVLYQGRIIQSGGKALAHEIEKAGYSQFIKRK